MRRVGSYVFVSVHALVRFLGVTAISLLNNFSVHEYPLPGQRTTGQAVYITADGYYGCLVCVRIVDQVSLTLKCTLEHVAACITSSCVIPIFLIPQLTTVSFFILLFTPYILLSKSLRHLSAQQWSATIHLKIRTRLDLEIALPVSFVGLLI
jgi:hypothetical protein